MDVDKEFRESTARVRRLIDERAWDLNHERDKRWPIDFAARERRRQVREENRAVEARLRAEQLGYNLAAMNESLRQGLEGIARGMQAFANLAEASRRR